MRKPCVKSAMTWNFVYLSGLLLQLFFGPNSFALSHDKLIQKQDKIAIIGGGASGLTTAYLLQKYGFQRVTVFERSKFVGGVAETVEFEGEKYDMSTMFVPGGSIEGDGIQRLVQEMIHVSREPLIPAVGFDAMSSSGELSPLNEELTQYTHLELKRQLLEGLGLMTKYASCFSRQIDGVTCGVISAENPYESILEWGERSQVPAFAHMITYTSDALGAGPVSSLPAAKALISGFSWTPVEAVRVLKYLDPDLKLSESTPKNILSLLNANQGRGSQRWWFFKNGYQSFWKSLVKYAGIQVRAAEFVIDLKRVHNAKRKGWLVKTENGSDYFDRVVIATTPRAAMNYLPDGESRELLQTAISRVPPNDVFLAKVEDFSQSGLPEQSAWWSDGFGLGTEGLIDPKQGGMVKPVFWQKRYDKQIILVGTYTLSPKIRPEEAYQVVSRYAKEKLGFQLVERLNHRRFYFPALPQDSVAWRVGWQRLQGEQGLYFVGEAFTGSGIPAIAIGLQNIVPQFLNQDDSK